jgi:hypothetical protein
VRSHGTEGCKARNGMFSFGSKFMAMHSLTIHEAKSAIVFTNGQMCHAQHCAALYSTRDGQSRVMSKISDLSCVIWVLRDQ